jgi:hypothetical protein
MLTRNTVFGALTAAGLGLGLAAVAVRDLPANPTDREATILVEASRTLSAEVLHASDALAMPTDVEVLGDRLILADDFADRNLRVLRRSDGAIERSFGTKGRGPREFESAYAIDVIDPSGQVMVHDPMLQRVTWIDLERDFEGDRWVSDRSVKLNADAMIMETASTPTGLIGTGTFTDARLAHLNPAGRLERTTGTPHVAPSEVSRRVWTRVYQSRLKPNPNRTRWAVASRFADRLEIYDADGVLSAMGDRPYGFDPEDLKTDDEGAVRFGYLDLATTESRIYALFSGRTRAEGSAAYGGLIHVFDWEGRLVDIWELDARLIALAVTPDGHRLYGIRHHPIPAVVTYALD